MALTRAALQKYGLEPDAVEDILKMHGNTIGELKDRIDDLNGKMAAAQKAQKTAEDALANASPKEDQSKLKGELETAQNTIETLKDQHAQEIGALKMEMALEKALGDQAHDYKLVAGLLDMEKITSGADGQLTGLDEQVKALRENRPFLFKEDDPESKRPEVKGMKPAEGAPPSPVGYKEQYDAAIEKGNMAEAIAIKQTAFAEGKGFM